MRVNEVFATLQGEGVRAGEASVFVRLSGCSARHACATSGVVCDTEFESGRELAVDELLDEVGRVGGPIKWIVWTGGEPTDQLSADVVAMFHGAGYQQQLETSGIRQVPTGLDWVTLSPKVAEHILARTFTVREDGFHVDELKYVRHAGQAIPMPALKAKTYCLSPHSDGERINPVNLAHCVMLVRQHPSWRLSVQQHKLWLVR